MEHFAVDLDAVLDEFELNEDQAEVAAARLQRQIEQGRLEIASSDATPASSYTDSPRLSLSTGDHGHLSAIPRKSSLVDSTLKTSNCQPALNSLLPAPVPNRAMVNTDLSKHRDDVRISRDSVEVTGQLESSDAVTQVVTELSPPSISVDSAVAVDEKSNVIGDVLVDQPDDVIDSTPCKTEHVLCQNRVVNHGASADGAITSNSEVTLKPRINGEVESRYKTETPMECNASESECEASQTPLLAENTTGSNVGTADDQTIRAGVGEGATVTVIQTPGGTALLAQVAEKVTCDEEPTPTTAPEQEANVSVSNTQPGSSEANNANAESEVLEIITTMEPSNSATCRQQTEVKAAAVIEEFGTDVSTTISYDNVDDIPSPDIFKTPPQETPPERNADPPEPSISFQQTSPSEVTAATSHPSSVMEMMQEVPAPPSTEPTSHTPADPVHTNPTPAIEPISFKAATDVSESELDSYLDQLEEDGENFATESTTREEDALEIAPETLAVDKSVTDNNHSLARQLSDEAGHKEVVNVPSTESPDAVTEAAFGGARPKVSPSASAADVTSPPSSATTPPPPSVTAAAETLKGGVISRLQSQVSIECVVDNSGVAGSSQLSATEEEVAHAVAGNTPQPPRPSSLSLVQNPPADSPSHAGNPSALEGAGDSDVSALATDSVSTTGGNIVTAPGAYEEARLAATRPPSATSAAAAPPSRGQLVSVSDEDKNLGKVAPVWVPDEDAAGCMECEQRFTVIRRRHHCRACGRVLCSACCNQRACLDYMEFREGRVCQRCKAAMERVQQDSARTAPPGGGPLSPVQQRDRPPNPNNPMEYCSTVPPAQQAVASRPPPTVMVPTGVLKRAEGSGNRTPSREAKQVMFSDGIRPGGDLSEPAAPAVGGGSGAAPSLVRPPHRRTARIGRADKSPAAVLKEARGCKDLAWRPDSGRLPPVYQTGSSGATVKHNTPEQTIVALIRAEKDAPWSFLINKNLMVIVKIFKLDCCVGRTCWLFSSEGLSTVGQEEVLVVLEALTDENSLPRDVFLFYHHLFTEAAKGNFVTELGHTLFSVPFLGSKDHGGFLFVRPTFQCLHNIPTPPQPFLVALLIQKWEAPWAKVFPLRLLLRLGAEFRYYPCPLVSVRHRKPVFFEVGHTIINLLADFRNFAYVLPTVHGMHIHMEEQQTSVLIPRNRFNQVLKAINNSNDHVLALGSSFSREADSHLVCMQNDDGQYQTQAINIQNRPRQVTGASFIVFNGALKSAAGVTAKSSIVEDGLMFQISPDTMQALRTALRQMQDFRIECGAVGQPPDETVHIRWTEDDRSHNLGVRSVIDDRPLDGVRSIRVHSGTDYVTEAKLIRWTELYLIKVQESSGVRADVEPPFWRLAEQAARGTCVALAPQLPLLADSDRHRVALRLTIDNEMVGYEAGSGGETLPPSCMQLLDSELVPVLHRHAAEAPDSPICLELLFHVIDR